MKDINGKSILINSGLFAVLMLLLALPFSMVFFNSSTTDPSSQQVLSSTSVFEVEETQPIETPETTSSSEEVEFPFYYYK